MFKSFFVSFLAVTIPLILGGIFALVFKKKDNKTVNSLIYVSLGTLLFLIIYEMIPETIELAYELDNKFGILYILLALLVFLALIVFAHKGIDLVLYKHKHHHCHHEHDHGHIDVFLEQKQHSFKKAGIALCIALIFHNLPEGMSLGIVLTNDFNDGLSLAISLGIHNLIMGLTMALPLLLSSMKKENVFLLLALSSTPSIIGAMLGNFLAGTNIVLNFIMLSFSCSVLIFVIIEEIKSTFNKDFKWYQVLFILVGILISFLTSFIGSGH